MEKVIIEVSIITTNYINNDNKNNGISSNEKYIENKCKHNITKT